MDDRIEHARLIGQIEVFDLPLPELQADRSPQPVLRRSLIIWCPPACLVAKLPRGYCVALRCDLSADGIRRLRRWTQSGYLTQRQLMASMTPLLSHLVHLSVDVHWPGQEMKKAPYVRSSVSRKGRLFLSYANPPS